MTKSRGMQGCVGVLLALFAIAASGCGDDADSADTTKRSAAAEAPDVFMSRMANLLETTKKTSECNQLNAINARSVTRFKCPPPKSLARSMASFEVMGTEEYGTGAVVDYRSGEAPEGAAVVLFVAPDRNWAISRFGLFTEPSVGTPDEESRPGFDRVVDRYLDAVERRDCAAFRKVAFPDDRPAKEVCRTTFGTGTAKLAKRLKANPAAEPRYQGGNATYGFYKLDTPKPKAETSTISVIRAGVGAGATYQVLDVTPSPTAADQRRAKQALRKQNGRP